MSWLDSTADVVTIMIGGNDAGFIALGACLAPVSQLQIFNVGINPTRAGIFEVLEQAGATYTLENLRDQLNEPVADVENRPPQFSSTPQAAQVAGHQS